MDTSKIAAGFRLVAEGFEAGVVASITGVHMTEGASIKLGADASQPAPTEAPKPRGRGRPPSTPAAAQAAPTAPAAALDPFVTAPAAPTATLEDVRKALTDLRAATTQDNAVAVMAKASGAPDFGKLKPEHYDAVVAAAKAAMPANQKAEDPFAATPAAELEKEITLEDLKIAVVNARKRTGEKQVSQTVMNLGGKAPDGNGGPEKPSLNALPKENYKEVIEALAKLPTTK